jgi:hypothetical protein
MKISRSLVNSLKILFARQAFFILFKTEYAGTKTKTPPFT